jgi:hypothetical protein
MHDAGDFLRSPQPPAGNLGRQPVQRPGRDMVQHLEETLPKNALGKIAKPVLRTRLKEA